MKADLQVMKMKKNRGDETVFFAVTKAKEHLTRGVIFISRLAITSGFV